MKITETSEKYVCEVELTERQLLAFRYLMNQQDPDLALLYGGAKGGGKSFFFCWWVVLWSRYLAKLFGLKRQIDRKLIPAVGWMGRKIGKHFKDTTLQTWRREIPAQIYREYDESEIIIDNIVKVHYGGLDSSETMNKFNSAEYAFIAIDQAEETERTDIDVLQASLRLKINGIQPPYKELYTANPADCWLLTDFIDNPLTNNYYIPALPTDNKHLPDNYIPRLDKAFRNSPGLLAAYKLGDWRAIKAANKLISLSQINDLKGITHHFPKKKKCLAIDPSTGGDKCMLLVIEDYDVVEQEGMIGERDTTRIAAKARMLMEKHQIMHVFVDTIGVGYGVACDIQKMCKWAKIHFVNTAETAYNDEMHYNRRAEIWWNVSLKIVDKKVPYPVSEELKRQLTNVLFTVRNGRILLEDKTLTKVRLGCSPDEADAYVMGIDGMDQIDDWRPIRDPYANNYAFEDSFFENLNPNTV